LQRRLPSVYRGKSPTGATSTWCAARSLPFVSANWKKTATKKKKHDHHYRDNDSNDGYLSGQVAIVDGSTGLERTFRQYDRTTRALATALHDMMQMDDVEDETNVTIALYAPNHVDYVPTVLAITMMGAKVTPINPAYTQRELETVLSKSRSRVLIAHSSVLDTALMAVRTVRSQQHHPNYLKEIVVLTDDDGFACPEGTTEFESLVEQYGGGGDHGDDHGEQRLLDETHPIVWKDTATYPCVLPYSSGTTGLPKGVCLTHANIAANLLQFEQVEGMAFAPDHKLVSPLPFFHIYAFTASLLYCAWKGQTLITMSKKFDLEEFCSLVERHRPQRAHLVPPICLGLAKHPVVDGYDLSSLQTVISAAAPLGKDTEAAVRRRLLQLQCVKQAWGMSELSPIGTCNSDFAPVTGSIGPLVSSTTAKIVDAETGKSLGPNEPGELVLKGPQVMLGYLDDPEKTAECLSPNGWLRTGDMAYYDENRYFFVTDRIKELIKVKGFPVAPAELEELLLTHEDIGDVAVIGIPDEISGEVPRAYVVKKPGHDASTAATESEIEQWVEERVAPYKRLRGGVVFADAIPKSASGKILRRVLRDSLSADVR